MEAMLVASWNDRKSKGNFKTSVSLEYIFFMGVIKNKAGDTGQST